MTARFGAVPVKVNAWFKVFLLVIFLITLLPLYFSVEVLWGARNMGYQVTPDRLEIIYAWKRPSIPLGEITSVEIVQPERLSRVGGSSAPGLYSGRWTGPKTGRITLYATELESLLVVRTKDGAWGITPADPAAMRAALLAGTPGHFPVYTSGRSPWLALSPIFLIVLVLVPGTWYIFRLLYRFPARLTYELGRSELVIETGWRPVRIPYSEIESVEETTLKGWPMRAYGSELKGIHWGLFYWAAIPGKRIHLYATQLKPIVLIRARKRYFGLSPADSSDFVATLRGRMGKE